MENNNVKLINEVLMQYDVLNLIELGAPEDEYSPEANAINDYIDKNGLINLDKEIIKVFKYYFELNLDESIAKNIADDIKEKLA